MDWLAILFKLIESLIFVIIGTILLKFLAERKGWNNKFWIAFFITGIIATVAFILNLTISILIEFLLIEIAIEVSIITIFFIIQNFASLMIYLILATFLIKHFYKKEVLESFIFACLLIFLRVILNIALNILFFPIQSIFIFI